MSDPLSEILTLLDARTHVSAGFVAGGDWSVRTASHPSLKFNTVVHGQAWLLIDGVTAPIALSSGDCFVLTRGSPFVLASDLALIPVDAGVIFSQTTGGMAHAGVGDSFLVLGGRMDLDPVEAGLLLDSLPPVILIPATSDHALRLQWLLRELRSEVGAAAPGSALFVQNLMQLMFIEALRSALTDAERPLAGWAGALSDPRIGAALKAIHEEPGRAWRHGELAALAGMSPSAFAVRFKTLVGAPPLDYHLTWRMRLAGRALRAGSETITAIGLSLGYGSDSAFSNAFKRVVGRSPARYRRDYRRAA